ncbi:MAG: autotransporter domain-containing protein, partial [Candidatus Berkiella sp.]
TIPIITGGGGSTINNPIIITPNSLLTSYGTTAPGGTVLNLVVTSNPIEDFANQSDTHGVADALDSIAASGVALTGSLQTIFNQLLTYGDVASLNEALSTLVPQVNGAIINEGVNAQNLTFNQIYDHINNQSFWDKHYGKLSSGIDAGDTNNPKSGWVQVFKQHGNQSPRGDMSGYKNDTWGVIVGGDAYYRDDLLLGGALSWSKLDIHDKSTPHLKTKADSYQAALYASLECATPWYYNGIVALAVNDYSSERYIRVGNVNLYPHADYDGWQAGAKLEAGYVYDHDTWQVIPMASAYYTHLSLDAYTETGANTASLNVRDASFDALILGGGFKLVNELVIENQRFFQGEFHTMVFYDLIGDTMALTAQFTGAGPNFRSNGFSPAKASLNLGANASLFSANNWIFSLSYDFDVKQDYTANAGFLRVRHEW